MKLLRHTIGVLIASLAAPAAIADVFVLPPDTDVVGAAGTVNAAWEDTLVDVGRRYGIGYRELTWANPEVDPWLPGRGTAIQLPTQYVLPQTERRGLVVNIAEYRMYFFAEVDGIPSVSTFPISIGRMDWATPLGQARITAKTRNPAWYPPQSIRREYEQDGRSLPRVVPAGPDNPLGAYALRLSVPGYLIHGTNRPAGVGMRVTHGCIRMFPEDIDWLFDQVSVETPVRLINQPYKLGWRGDDLLLEVHPPLAEDGESEQHGLTDITELYIRATRDRPAKVDWRLVEQVYAERLGVAVVVGQARKVKEANESVVSRPAEQVAPGKKKPRPSGRG